MSEGEAMLIALLRLREEIAELKAELAAMERSQHALQMALAEAQQAWEHLESENKRLSTLAYMQHRPAELLAERDTANELLRRALEEMRLIRMKDCDRVYDVGLRAAISAHLTPTPRPDATRTDSVRSDVEPPRS